MKWSSGWTRWCARPSRRRIEYARASGRPSASSVSSVRLANGENAERSTDTWAKISASSASTTRSWSWPRLHRPPERTHPHWATPLSRGFVPPWASTATWSHRRPRHCWSAPVTSRSITWTRYGRGPSRPSGQRVFRASTCSRQPGRRGGRTSRTASPKCSGIYPHPTGVSLSHLLLGTDHHPEAALLWRHASDMSPAEVPAEIVTDWRAELVALTPAILAFSDRRRRRLRDRSRRGDNLRHVFEQTLDGVLACEDVSLAI